MDGNLSVRAASFAEARARAGGDPARTFALDFTLGAWRPRHAARDLAAQLGVVLDERVTPYDALEPRGEGVDLGEMIGAGVDAESRGDATVRIAFDDAERIAAALPDGALVLAFAPRFGASRRREDDAFVRFARAFGVDLREVVWSGDDDATHALAAAKADVRYLAPGLASEAFDGTVALPGTAAMIEPGLRIDPRAVPRARFDRLADDARYPAWLRAYAQLFGNNLYVEARDLASVAWSAYLEGSVEIALDLLDRAIACAKTPLERAIALARAQGVRIAALRYDEASLAPEPPPNVPAELRDFIAQTKGWGLALDGKPLEAQRWFARPLAALENKAELTVADLYLLNIYAFSCFRSGDTTTALALERAIAERHAALPQHDARLEHINRINLARLLRRAGDPIASGDSYDRAFATSDGLRAWPEVIQLEAIAAGRAAAAGNAAEADDAWLRAALAWLADPVPEALGRRTVAAVLEGPAPEQDRVAEAVASALLARLAPRARALRFSDDSALNLLAVREARDDEPIDAIVGRSGWCVALAPAQRPRRPRSGDAAELERCAIAIVAAAAPATLPAIVRHDAEGRSGGAPLAFDVVVDMREGRGLARTREEAYDLAIRREARAIGFDDAVAALDRDEQTRARSRLRLTLAPGVASVEGPNASRATSNGASRVTYKRFLAPRALAPHEAALVDAVANAGTDGLRLDDCVADRATIEGLTRAHVLVPLVTEDRCIEAGISSPSSGN